MFKSGYIAIIGRPNVGKSTLLNKLLGQKVAAVSPKPQTTRHRILGVKHLPEAQLLFLDTPGIHKPHKSLNEQMMEMAQAAIHDADLFLFMVESALLETDREIYRQILSKKKPILLLINKVDKSGSLALIPFMEQCQSAFHPEAIIPISALSGAGCDIVETEILKRLPEGPAYFPEDQVTDQTERLIASEVVREKVMGLTQKEVPYSVTVQTETYEEPKKEGGLTRIRAAIIVEKDSQKGILIGKGGQMIKKIGESARKDLEAQLGGKVFLELFVRVEKDWTKDPKKVRELGSF